MLQTILVVTQQVCTNFVLFYKQNIKRRIVTIARHDAKKNTNTFIHIIRNRT